jgi:hypothetical protein
MDAMYHTALMKDDYYFKESKKISSGELSN